MVQVFNLLISICLVIIVDCTEKSNVTMVSKRKLIDIGANLNDPMFSGMYNGMRKHEPDLDNVLKRAWVASLDKIIISGGSLKESTEALKLAQTDARLYSTVGCHPTRCDEFEQNGADKYFHSLYDLASSAKNKVVAIGECGLDYDRLQFCSKDIQKKYFERQLNLSESLKLPLFLHCRNACNDLVQILKSHQQYLNGGVVHSFDGTVDELRILLDLGYYIGINGCSLKTEENLQVVKEIPKDRILLETDSPWCEVRPSHAGSRFIKTTFPSIKKEKWEANSMVKSRNEPARIIQILEILSTVRGEDPDSLSEVIYSNTLKLFFPQHS